MLYDTHMHLNADHFTEDIEEVILRARARGVQRMNVVGYDRKSIERALDLMHTYDDVYGIIGWHPVDSIYLEEGDLDWIETLCQTEEKIVAYGEIGLDYHWDTSPKELQQELFREQIRRARKLKLPIIIHAREALMDTYTILCEEGAAEVGGVMHSYAGSVEMLPKFLELNFSISLGGTVTFKNAKTPKDVAQHVPLEKLLLETDAPYLTPVPYRGKRNEPSYVYYVAEEIAKLRSMDIDELTKITYKNARTLFQTKSEREINLKK